MSKRVDRVGFGENNMMCCGMMEYDGLNQTSCTTVGALKAMCEDGNFVDRANGENEDGCSHILLTQMYHDSTGEREGCKNLTAVMAYIRRYKLGTVVAAPVKMNPNSGNMIKPALFTPDLKAFGVWGASKGIVDWREQERIADAEWAERRDSMYADSFDRW